MKGTVAVDWAAELVGVASELDAVPTSITGAELTNPKKKRAIVQEEIIILLDRSLTCKSFFIQTK
jgi:ABC-type thiamine transport system ATPase subunit